MIGPVRIQTEEDGPWERAIIDPLADGSKMHRVHYVDRPVEKQKRGTSGAYPKAYWLSKRVVRKWSREERIQILTRGM